MFPEGTQISHYQLLGRIGSGGMGEVYEATDLSINRHVAIKVIKSQVATDANTIRLFLREARAIAALDHPHILQLFECGEALIEGEKHPYIVMPLRMEGSLKSWLERGKATRPISLQTVAAIVQQAADALQHAHNRQILHLDIKPANFLLFDTGKTDPIPYLLLADFGLAYIMTTESTVNPHSSGTPYYMPPEQWRGKPVMASDQYALAIMTYELLTGRLPFLGTLGQLMYQHVHDEPVPPSTLNPALPKEIDPPLLRALAKQPEERFSSVADFDQAFQYPILGITSLKLQETGGPPPSTGSAISQQEAFQKTSGAPKQQQVSTSTSDSAIPSTSYTSPQPWQWLTAQRKNPIFIVSLILSVVLLSAGIITLGGTSQKWSAPPSTAPVTSVQQNPTTRALATITAAQNRYNQLTNKPPTINDPLVDNNQGYRWQEFNTPSDGFCKFDAGAYHISRVRTNQFTRCTAGGTNYSDFVYQIEATIIKGDQAGVIFRFNRSLAKFYSFYIGVDGAYTLDTNDSNGFLSSLTDGQSPLIKTGYNQPNVITIVAQGSNITIYINKQFLKSVNDTTYSQGLIGVAANDMGEPTEVAFSNMQLWQL